MLSKPEKKLLQDLQEYYTWCSKTACDDLPEPIRRHVFSSSWPSVHFTLTHDSRSQSWNEKKNPAIREFLFGEIRANHVPDLHLACLIALHTIPGIGLTTIEKFAATLRAGIMDRILPSHMVMEDPELFAKYHKQLYGQRPQARQVRTLREWWQEHS